MAERTGNEQPGGEAAWLTRWTPWLIGIGLAAVIQPDLAVAHDNWEAVTIAIVAALIAGWLAPAGWLAILGVAMVALAGWLFRQTTFPWTEWLIAIIAGGGVGLALPNIRGRIKWETFIAVVASGAGLILVRWLFGIDAAIILAVIAVAGMAAVAIVQAGQPQGRGRSRRWQVAVSGLLALLITLGSTAWVGASTAHVTWFGSLVSHGSRNGNLVAITFDDGPNVDYSLKIAHILDEYGVKATFFTVGKALAKRPDISRQLLADGQLLGNHSYTHNSTAWLDPRYPEFDKTEALFKKDVGVCPAFFRPPHGTHTPLMAHQVHNVGGTVITWDISAGDWSTTNGQLVADRVLSRVKPGSIILLHDGIDGDLTADRSVIITALPIILQGLQKRGLHPVTLDKLLGAPGYVKDC